MIVAGIDIGSLSAKAVILKDNEILGRGIILTGADSEATAREVMEKALKETGLWFNDLQSIVATGYGRYTVPFAQNNVTEISCHARGAHWFCPDIRTILDMGGQDCKAIRCDETGKVINFVMNDKCAAGTGRYLERVAATLNISLDDLGPFSLKPEKGAANIASYCVVFAETDIIILLRQGRHVNDIAAGACDAIVSRIMPMLRSVGVEEDFAITGGVAKNAGVVKRLEQKLGVKTQDSFEPQLVGALGAALFARERLEPEMPASTIEG